VINDPATDEGPEITRKLGGETTDDNDDDDDGGDNGDGEQSIDTETADDSPATTGEEGGESAESENGSDGADTSNTSDEAPHRLPLTQTPQNRLVSNRTPKPIHPTTDTDEPQTAANTDGTAETTATSDDQDADADEDDTATPTDESTETESETGKRPRQTRLPPRPNRTILMKTTRNSKPNSPSTHPKNTGSRRQWQRLSSSSTNSLTPRSLKTESGTATTPTPPTANPKRHENTSAIRNTTPTPAPPSKFNERADLIKQNLTAEDGRAEYEISPAASREIDATTASNDSVITSDEDGDQSNDSVITPDEDGDQSNDSVITPDEDATDADDSESMVLYNYQTRDNRGWSPETIESKKLGWAPRDTDSLREHLLDEGFSIKELFATGLFNDIGDGGLLPFMQARYIIPYFDADGEPVFLISRSIDTDMEQDKQSDFHRPTKIPQAQRGPHRRADLRHRDHRGRQTTGHYRGDCRCNHRPRTRHPVYLAGDRPIQRRTLPHPA